MHACGSIAEIDERIPERQTVLASGDRNEHVLLRREHPFLLDAACQLPLEEEEETLTAERGVVMPHLNFRLRAAPFAFHDLLPVVPQSWPLPGCAGKRLSTRDDVADLDLVIRFEHLLFGDELVTANHHDRTGNQIERFENFTDTLSPRDLNPFACR
jgi:hypothetical protein